MRIDNSLHSQNDINKYKMKFFNSFLSPILVLNQCLMTIHLPTHTYIHNYKIIFDSVILGIPYYHIEEPDSIAPINAVKNKS